MQNNRILASLSSPAGWFESYLVENHEDRFSHIKVHLIVGICKGGAGIPTED